MFPKKIEERFIQLTIDFSGTIKEIVSGTFALEEFKINDSIYNPCPFLEFTITDLPLKETLPIFNLVFTFNATEFNVDVELFKSEQHISVLIIDRTLVYGFVKELNQDRNEISMVKDQLNRQNKELERLRNIAEKANKEKSRFLAMVSHEVRNPLNSILGYGGMIATETENHIVQDYTQSLLMAGKNLKVIVDDILDLSRIEAGKLQLVFKRISLQKVIEKCIKDFNLNYKNSSIKLQYSLSNDLPKWVIGDPVRLTQILSNLINNSFKFTKEGSISVAVKIASKENNRIFIDFTVTDTGRGMSHDQIQTIFNEYEQLREDDHTFGGVGLGLSIVKRLVVAMSGKISVKSKLNVGTSFLIQIPFKKAPIDEDTDILKENIKDKKYDLSGLEILFADDDQLSHMIVGHILSNEGASITIVNDGLEALSALQDKTFDVVLLDINMPNMTGEELIKKRQEFIEYNHKTPLLALTANNIQEDIEKYLALGFASVISKPYTLKDIVTAIEPLNLK